MHISTLLLSLPLTVLSAPLLSARGADVLTGKFLVVLHPNSQSLLSTTIDAITARLGQRPHKTYNFGAFQALSIAGTTESLISTLLNLPAIQFIEPDTVVRASAILTQTDAPYGLARISHRDAGSTSYVYDSSAGAGTIAYGIDTGIYCGHSDFSGRCTFGANFAGDGNNTDGNGHGTHTAGTLGGTRYGVAKKTQLVAVKVLGADGSGATSGVIEGIQWAANDMVKRGKKGKAVANLSLGGPRLGEASNRAVAAAVEMGLFMAVAAGNSGVPVVFSSPSSEPSACTVAASDSADKFASFSNFGALVDIIAPGVNVLSAWIGGPNDSKTISGTSMAAPHVAGLGAYLLALEGSLDPIALCERIKTLSTKNKIKGATLTKNQLAFNGVSA